MALIGVLIVGLAIVSFLLFRSHSANQEMQQLFEVEKEEMENEYSNFANQYDELQIKSTTTPSTRSWNRRSSRHSVCWKSCAR